MYKVLSEKRVTICTLEDILRGPKTRPIDETTSPNDEIRDDERPTHEHLINKKNRGKGSGVRSDDLWGPWFDRTLGHTPL